MDVNRLIEPDTKPLLIKKDHSGIRYIMGSNFMKFFVLLFIKSGAGCGSLRNGRSRSRIGSSYPTAGEKVCMPALTWTLDPAVPDPGILVL